MIIEPSYFQQNKMIRYVSEKQVEVQQPSPKGKSLSPNKSSNNSREKVWQGSQQVNSSIALRELKKINEEKETIKGRLSILQAQEEKNQFKAFLSEQRYQFHLQMRDEMEKARYQKALHHRNLLLKLQDTQDQARHDRLTHKKNLRKANQQLHDLKVSDYITAKQRSKDIQQSLELSRSIEEHKKKERQREVRQYERSQRETVKEYHEEKLREIHHKDSSDSLKLSGLKQERQKQINELSRLQAMMMERHSRSKMTSDQNERRLKQLLGGKKALSTSHTQQTKLPLLNPEKRNIEHELLVL